MNPLYQRRAYNSTLLWFLFFTLIVLLFIISPENSNPVSFPMIALLCIAGTYYWRVDFIEKGRVSYFEIGSVYVAIITLYGVFPLLGYIINGLQSSATNDGRLYRASPLPVDFGAVGWYYVVYLLCFSFGYLTFRQAPCRTKLNISKPNKTEIFVIIATYISIRLLLFALGYFYDLTYDDYRGLYLVQQRVPMLGYIQGIAFTLELFMLIILFQQYNKFKWVVILWCIIEIAIAVYEKESRTRMFLMLTAAVMIYNYLQQRIRPAAAISLGSVALFMFLALGWVRSTQELNYQQFTSPFSHSTEFESLFGNAWDLNTRVTSGSLVRPGIEVYLANFFSLIPQTFLPFEKTSASSWYAYTFYPSHAATGAAFDFGVIAESIIGFGICDLALRGLLTGFAFAKIHQYCIDDSRSFWRFSFYVWVTVQSYLLFRNSSFVLLAPAIYRFALIYFIIKIITFMMSRVAQKPIKAISRSACVE